MKDAVLFRQKSRHFSHNTFKRMSEGKEAERLRLVSASTLPAGAPAKV
jgi:hypothetical protein